MFDQNVSNVACIGRLYAGYVHETENIIRKFQFDFSFLDISQVVNWIDLPCEIWEKILSYLDGKSLIRVSETCLKLNEVVDLNRKLIDKLWLKLYVNDSSAENFSEVLKVIKNSRREYKQLFIHYVMSQWFENELFVEVLQQLGRSVKALATDSVKFRTRKDLVNTLRLFPHLRRLQIKLVTVEEQEPEKQYLKEFVHLPHLADLYMVEYYPWLCDVLSPCVNIKRLESYIVKWTERDPVPFENFLFKQKSLQKLRLGIFRQGRLFKDDRSGEIKFQLQKLLLNGAFFYCREHIFNFIKTQRKLKKLQINLSNEYERKLDRTLFFNGIMVFVLTEMPELSSLSINQERFKFPDFDFIFALPQNNKIVSLRIEGEAVDVFQALITSVLPNIKKLSYEANLFPTSVPNSAIINQMQNLETLILDKFFIESLQEIHIEGGKLKTFEFIARWMSEDFEQSLRIFLERHSSLTRLRIGVIKFLANLFVTMEMCEDIVTNLIQLKSLNIQNFEDINAEASYLANNLNSLQLLEVSFEQYKLLTTSTLDECSFNGVCIAVGK